ncbi:MAG: hypothetical protein KJ040_01435 [Gammaproteobacteria bacterium]|nr:hypothetical protein [Gammaproteobacteria bacterium]
MPALRLMFRPASCRCAVLLAGLVLFHAVPAADAPVYRAQGLDQPTIDFVLGNFEFVLLHELAHVVIGELEVPVLGPEEDAADYLASTALLNATRGDPLSYQRANKRLLAAAEGLRLSWLAGAARGGELPYWNNHSLNIQRFYSIACLLYGNDPEAFADLPAAIGMPAARADSCTAEWQKADRSFHWLLDNFGRKPGEAAGPQIGISYAVPGTLAAAGLLREIRADGMLERVANAMRERIILPRELALRMRSCGRPEAAWQPEQRELVLCFELLDALYQLSAGRDAAFNRSGGVQLLQLPAIAGTHQ